MNYGGQGKRTLRCFASASPVAYPRPALSAAGPLEFLFVVDSEADLAWQPLAGEQGECELEGLPRGRMLAKIVIHCGWLSHGCQDTVMSPLSFLLFFAAHITLAAVPSEAPGKAVVRRIVAGSASHCSQKIHK